MCAGLYVTSTSRTALRREYEIRDCTRKRSWSSGKSAHSESAHPSAQINSLTHAYACPHLATTSSHPMQVELSPPHTPHASFTTVLYGPPSHPAGASTTATTPAGPPPSPPLPEAAATVQSRVQRHSARSELPPPVVVSAYTRARPGELAAAAGVQAAAAGSQAAQPAGDQPAAELAQTTQAATRKRPRASRAETGARERGASKSAGADKVCGVAKCQKSDNGNRGGDKHG